MQYKVKQTFEIKYRTNSTGFEVNQVVDEKHVYGILQELGLIEEIEECKHEERTKHGHCCYACGRIDLQPEQEQIKPSQWIIERAGFRSEDFTRTRLEQAILDFLDEHFSK